MLRKLVATVIAAAAISLGAPAVAQAQPHMCDNHGFGSGMIYKAACGSGSGGAAAEWTYAKNPDGTDKMECGKHVYKIARHSGGGRYGVETTDPW
ncbi:hypothetical protein SEA_FILCH_32 [Mycobacterium phage Filch]|uniref:Uncharacterized protein n=2 Tax=Kostyavirus eureka TaxID=1074306 RepID=G1JWQ1_9CAUD|nr:hypothetical protein GOKU_31 [Mycobacterium phage Goku]YP_009591571.1 hypothetical protein FDG60_gp031 [Mycobacterium phage Eureka]AEL98049.1 hypothetical protein EUREKA_31 [Mycobacterium phage Eureka]AGT14140.1 hypothetical protein GOKU_31 [Mycobacterium phage Goku]QZD97315.1 hypothetical protein SEA_FILCH_32 [Mycobacterium phage Filch]